MSEAIESMLARIDERTKRMDDSMNDLWKVASETKDKVSKMEGADVAARTRVTEADISTIHTKIARIETKVAPLWAGAATLVALVVGFIIDLFKGPSGV